MAKLTNEQRDFFQTIYEMAFSNPFSLDLWQLEARLFPQLNEYENILHKPAMDLIDNYWQQLHWNKKINRLTLSKKDNNLLTTSWLYYHYRCYEEQFDDYIQTQKQQGDTPLVLPFGKELVNDFRGAGFSEAETAHYISLFFQLRRGFYFISRHAYGLSSSMRQLRIKLWSNIFTFQSQWYLDCFCGYMEDFSTLLLGETGTGKSFIAEAIGCSGLIPFDIKKQQFQVSFTQAFLAINLSQYPASLLESELFGHKRGAFTGAIEQHLGLFARCSLYGAVFIDEIGDIDIPTQVKLLTVLQDRYFCPVGSHEKQRFAGRVIAATHQDIQALRQNQQFRDDLYYRLCSDVIKIPSLQQRLSEHPQELLGLLKQIIQRLFPQASEQLTLKIHQHLVSTLPKNYSWSGNIRELEQCIRHICLNGSYHYETAVSPNNRDKEVTAQQLLQQYCGDLYQKYGNYEAVARITDLDRRTVKKYVLME